jgi:nucleotide-binding universal stress UspA family protein
MPGRLAMPLRTILVPLTTGIDPTPSLDAALAVARRTGAHVGALFARPDATSVVGLMGEAAVDAGTIVAAFERGTREAAAAARGGFEAWRERNGLPREIVERRLDSVFASWREEEGDVERIVTRRGRLGDLLVVRLAGPGEAGAATVLDAAVFGSGRPVLLAPERLPDDLFRHVVVAWNGSLEATRAVAGSMVLLREAERVSVFAAPSREEADAEPGADLVEALRWHGITAHRLGPAAGARAVGEALLHEAAGAGATMIVMGAYTHSRVREMFLGGVTRHVLAHATVPVIMAH